jgi:colanic acid/amylovoran biosynthesis glycosyltransferase
MTPSPIVICLVVNKTRGRLGPSIGLPVVATRHGGIRDVVEDGVTGFLVDEHDENGMTDAMARLATDPALAGRLGHAGAQAVASRWSMEHSLARLSAIIQDVYNQERRST